MTSLKFVPMGPFYNIPTLVQIMAWRRIGDKPLSEPMMDKVSDAYVHHLASMIKLDYFDPYQQMGTLVY